MKALNSIVGSQVQPKEINLKCTKQRAQKIVGYHAMVLILLKVQNMGAIPSAVKRNLTLKKNLVVEFSCWIPFLGPT